MYTCIFYVYLCINIYIADKISSWSVLLSFCSLLTDRLFSNSVGALESYFKLYCIFAD